MSGDVIFLTHADVAIDPDVPVPDWGLNETGRQRHAAFAQSETLAGVTALYASSERKAREAAEPVAARLDLTCAIREALGENDRSATGYLPEDAFWPIVHAFFDHPDTSAHGWETARDAQTRIAGAVRAASDEAPGGDTLIVAHGGVGALLRCWLMNTDITRSESQPHPKGGCWFRFSRAMNAAPTDWRAI
ncbi:histidine phosphatase family protein [Pseudaestuariivita sp.]|uniref:histidine phosphatase family protein n=1 Tax=Pseudaestuariivita sp. TaxID=2211669 RepID=UPI0040588680